MEITKEEMVKKANEWLTTEKFCAQQNGAKIEVTPISSCALGFPVNVIATGVLNGFIAYLFKDNNMLVDLLKDVNIPPENS